MMIKNKSWKSFIIFDIRHEDEFRVVKIILCQLGYKYDDIEPYDYNNSICFFPGRDDNMKEFSVISAQVEQEAEKGYLMEHLVNMRFGRIFNVKDFLDWHNKNKLN